MLAGTVLGRQNSRPALCASLLRETPEGRTGRARSHGMRLCCSCDTAVPCRWGSNSVLKVPGSDAFLSQAQRMLLCQPAPAQLSRALSMGTAVLCQGGLSAAGMLMPSSSTCCPAHTAPAALHSAAQHTDSITAGAGGHSSCSHIRCRAPLSLLLLCAPPSPAGHCQSPAHSPQLSLPLSASPCCCR